MMEKKKLVVIGANDFQNQLILKAKQRGMETFVFAWKDGAIGEKTADHFYPISILEKEEILKECKKIKPDGVISIASDLASITVNYIAEELGLTGNGVNSAKIATDKYLMRKAFAERKDPSPWFCRSDKLTDEDVRNMKFPVIVKPVDRSGSRGITKVLFERELNQAIQEAEKVSFARQAIIEEYVEGEEFSVEYISYHGKHVFLALTKKFTTGAPHYIETGHMEPASVKTDTLDRIKRMIPHALDTLEIKNGASHSEIKINDKGEIVIIEIGGRMGGDCIGSDLVQISTGYDFVNMVIDVSCGIEPKFNKICEPAFAEVHFIFNEEDMEKLEELKRTAPETIYRISEIEPLENREILDSSTRYGYYITRN